MPVMSRAEIVKRLTDAANRMNRVRETAETQELVRRGAEPEPLPRGGELMPPPSPFIGQPERARPT